MIISNLVYQVFQVLQDQISATYLACGKEWSDRNLLGLGQVQGLRQDTQDSRMFLILLPEKSKWNSTKGKENQVD